MGRIHFTICAKQKVINFDTFLHVLKKVGFFLSYRLPQLTSERYMVRTTYLRKPIGAIYSFLHA